MSNSSKTLFSVERSAFSLYAVRCILYASVAIFLFSGPAQAKYSGGTGEPNDPYQIATAADLIALGETPADYDKHFLLTADIDLDPNLPGRKVFDRAVIAADTNDTKSGFQGTAFTGVFDGEGHTISHLTITGKDWLGLFGCLGSKAEVKNLGVVDVNVTGSGDYIGGLIGRNYGTLTQCYSTGLIGGDSVVGGLVGSNGYDDRVTHCCSQAMVSGISTVGGLVGLNAGAVSRSCSMGAVSAMSDVGGLIGANVRSQRSNGRVSDCYSAAAVSGTENVGGLLGHHSGGVTHCYSVGPVRSTGEPVGGLVGYGFGEIPTDAGGPIRVEGTVTGCFWDIQTSGQTTSAGGMGKTTAQMHEIRTYQDAGWDFVGEDGNGLHETWQMLRAGEYPVLAILNGYTPPRLRGLGTREDPYLITDATELGAMIYYSPDAHYRLAASIELSGIRWGMAVIPWFSGTFDGNGLMISNLAINGESNLGLFGQILPGAEVKSLGVVDVNVTGSGSIGGLIGRNYGTLTQCYSTGAVSGNDDVGGLVGSNDGTVTRCYSTGAVIGIGWGVGGLVGHSEGAVTQCYATGAVGGENDVGGLVGYSTGGVTQCYSTGAVGGEFGVGGLVGYHYGTVTQCYSTGAVSGTSCVGGLVGSGSRVISSFWDIQTSGLTWSDGGTPKTTAEMQMQSTFTEAGWDFVGETVNGIDDIWKIAEGLDYPRLWWEPHDGRVTVVLGRIFTVTLESNPSTGYRWEWVDHQDSIVEQMGQAQFKPRETGDPPLVGAGGWESFDFKAVHQGQMTLKLVYRRPWEEGVEPLKTFLLQVTVP